MLVFVSMLHQYVITTTAFFRLVPLITIDDSEASSEDDNSVIDQPESAAKKDLGSTSGPSQARTISDSNQGEQPTCSSEPAR